MNYPDLYQSKRINLVPPTSYQGGKIRIASEILKHIKIPDDFLFYDFCCGSGSISLSLINSGFDPSRITMVDFGPYGIFWERIANKEFDLDYFKKICDSIPNNLKKVSSYLDNLSRQKCEQKDIPYMFLLLQSGAFGGKSIWIDSRGFWMNCSFRNYWEPKEGCNRKSPVNPMMPMPKTLFQRVSTIVKNCSGIKAYCKKIEEISLPNNCIVYIDPPYKNTTGYISEFDIEKVIEKIKVPCYVSEGIPLGNNSVLISEPRVKGGINGKRTKNGSFEYLSKFNMEN